VEWESWRDPLRCHRTPRATGGRSGRPESCPKQLRADGTDGCEELWETLRPPFPAPWRRTRSVREIPRSLRASAPARRTSAPKNRIEGDHPIPANRVLLALLQAPLPRAADDALFRSDTFHAPTPEVGDPFGRSVASGRERAVALSGDVAVVSSFVSGAAQMAGTAHVFARAGGACLELERFQAPSPLASTSSARRSPCGTADCSCRAA
jgi:hypothetical protein